MADNDRYDALHENTIGKWARKKEKMEDDHRSAAENLKRYLKAAIGKVGDQTRQNVARDILDARRHRTNKLNQDLSGFSNQDDDVVTGMEEFPWDRDVE